MKHLAYFSTFEKALWGLSVLIIGVSFFLFDRGSLLSLIASLIGVTFLIFNAKGHPLGQFLTIVFGVLYGIISLSFSYYGEMITYLGMTAPMALLALISWLRHPFAGNRKTVRIDRLSRKEWILIWILTVCVTVVFYFLLSALKTANILPSTISVMTSFLAACLTFRRSPYFALAYAANDLVLILLWGLASASDKSYISVMICFVVFLVNDLYGFLNWKRMEQEQAHSRGDLTTADH